MAHRERLAAVSRAEIVALARAGKHGWPDRFEAARDNVHLGLRGGCHPASLTVG